MQKGGGAFLSRINAGVSCADFYEIPRELAWAFKAADRLNERLNTLCQKLETAMRAPAEETGDGGKREEPEAMCKLAREVRSLTELLESIDKRLLYVIACIQL